MRLTAVFVLIGIFCDTGFGQPPADRALLEAEQARDAGVPVLLKAVSEGTPHAQQLAARALGRLEVVGNRDALLPLLKSKAPAVRIAAAGAMAQMRAPFEWAPVLKAERDPAVRAMIHEAIGRGKPLSDDAEALLTSGLTDPDPRAGTGAARGLESLFRLNNKPPRHAAAGTMDALHAAFAANRAEEIRELILLTMNALADGDSATLKLAMADPSPQVRRLAVIATKQWTEDPSPLVRYEALRLAPTCERAAAAVSDASLHVALLGVDQLGKMKCPAPTIAPLIASEKPWRIRAHAIESLAASDPAQARPAVVKMSGDPIWQVRAWTAKAARTVNDTSTLAKLARDPEPNVAIAALTTTEDALYAIGTSHSGLILAGAEKLKGFTDLRTHLPALTSAFRRLTATGAMTLRDPRVALLMRIAETKDPSAEPLLREALKDRDPAIAAVAARALGVDAITTKLPIPPLPSAEYIRALEGASARFMMRDLGVITIDLLTQEAPVTVATFAQVAEAGKYNGLTFHRIVSNFVIQGGSPGADEYDGRSTDFQRDELGLARNARGSIGISTRGRDTGDAQIYFNLVDNFRLDRDYTVMAQMREGMAVMDRIQEGDVIERVEIVRRGSK